jgi:D-tyrosyl-tRNA(Tyr) deacylase
MKAVVQRVIDASVTVNGALKGGVDYGLLVYLGVARDDAPRDADWLVEKIANLRIFDDPEGKMNLSLTDIVNQNNDKVNDFSVNYDKNKVNNASVNQQNDEVIPIGVLAVSQFTLLGDARKGRRPTWDKAAPPEKALELYLYFIEKMSLKLPCASGEFQTHMKVSYTNDGPVTILLDSSAATA